MQLEILETPIGDTMVVQLSGRVTGANASMVSTHLAGLMRRGAKAVVIDLSGLDHMTSLGLRALLIAEKEAVAFAMKIVLCGMRPLVHEVFDISGMLEIFHVAPSRSEAMLRLELLRAPG